MPIDPGIFRAYDVRGKVGTSITPEVAEALGRAFGTYVAEHEGGTEIAVGRDNRASGEQILFDGIPGAPIHDGGRLPRAIGRRDLMRRWEAAGRQALIVERPRP